MAQIQRITVWPPFSSGTTLATNATNEFDTQSVRKTMPMKVKKAVAVGTRPTIQYEMLEKMEASRN